MSVHKKCICMCMCKSLISQFLRPLCNMDSGFCGRWPHGACQSLSKSRIREEKKTGDAEDSAIVRMNKNGCGSEKQTCEQRDR